MVSIYFSFLLKDKVYLLKTGIKEWISFTLSSVKSFTVSELGTKECGWDTLSRNAGYRAYRVTTVLSR